MNKKRTRIKKSKQQADSPVRFFPLVAKTLFGLEEVLAKEIEALACCRNIEIQKRAVSFETDLGGMYKANLHLRTALRIIKPIHRFQARHTDTLYKKVKQVAWEKMFRINETFAVEATVFSPYFNHSHYVALKTKDAIADRFKEEVGMRPSVDTEQPDFVVHVHIYKDFGTILIDSSGASLHKRAYRVEITPAPLNEVLAAGMILLSGWKGETDFLDPMCGSGTLPIEAALIATNTPPQFKRKQFGFQKWPDYDEKLWMNIVEEAQNNLKESLDIRIYGRDKDAAAIEIAQKNVVAAGMEDIIQLECRHFEQTSNKIKPNQTTQNKQTLILNPPYGERLYIKQIEKLYQHIGDQFKQAYTGCEAWVLTSNMDALKKIGLRPSKKYNLYNGKLACKYYRFELYEGSKKKKHNL